MGNYILVLQAYEANVCDDEVSSKQTETIISRRQCSDSYLQHGFTWPGNSTLPSTHDLLQIQPDMSQFAGHRFQADLVCFKMQVNSITYICLMTVTVI